MYIAVIDVFLDLLNSVLCEREMSVIVVYIIIILYRFNQLHTTNVLWQCYTIERTKLLTIIHLCYF